MSIPVISSSVAMLKMMEMPYSSAIVHYLSALLRKNYSFPRKVITILTEYLLKFQSYEKELPIVWHQLLLTFAKQYSSSIDEMGKGALI